MLVEPPEPPHTAQHATTVSSCDCCTHAWNTYECTSFLTCGPGCGMHGCCCVLSGVKPPVAPLATVGGAWFTVKEGACAGESLTCVDSCWIGVLCGKLSG